MPARGRPQPWRGGEGAANPVHLPQRGRPVPLHLPEREATTARQRRQRARQRLRVLEPQAPARSQPGDWRDLGKGGHAGGRRGQTSESRIVSNCERGLETYNSTALGRNGCVPVSGSRLRRWEPPSRPPTPCFSPLFSPEKS